MGGVLSIALNIAWHLSEIAVVIAMFTIATSPFETLVVAGLVLTYLSVAGSATMLGRALSEKFNQDTARFIELAKALRIDSEPYEAALAEDRETIEKGNVNFWIGTALRWLLAFIAAWHLVEVLWLTLNRG